MKLTIITSLYQSEEYLDTFFKSVKPFHQFLNKQKIDFEHLLILNDGTDEEIKTIERNFEINFKLIKIPRESLYATWNRGVELARGENITFWNVDDQRKPEAIIEGLKLIESGYDLVYFPFVYKRYVYILWSPFLVKIKKINPREFEKQEFEQSMLCGPFFMFKKSFFNLVGPFDENFKIAGDFDWCIRAAKIGKFKKGETVAGVFKNYGKSLSGSKDTLHQEENSKIYKKYGINK